MNPISILKTDSFAGNFIVRLLVGAVFLSEGIQKFLFPDSVGAGRFEKIGIPSPDFFAPFVGVVEISCGSLILLGLFTRLASVPLIINMIVAIMVTQIPILWESGFWKMAHDSRTDYSMILGSLYLLMFGGGKWSLDILLFKESHKLND